MLDKKQHRVMMIKILKEIYSDHILQKNLGFKGGTAAFLFYDLPRFSVDLDFDLLNAKKKKAVFARLKEILPYFGQVKDASEKRFTLFFLLNYAKNKRNLKIEISKRSTRNNFSLKSYLGIPILLIKKEAMLAGKLSALLTRKKFATRDLYDLWFFLKNEWLISEIVLEKNTGLSQKQAFEKAVLKVKDIKEKQLLQGLGELLEDKQKDWVKKSLKKETLFYLNLMLDKNKL